ncbi:hypothetical protein RAE21_06365 [Rhodoferax sp. TBRC 17198]|uniref:hypothetical protein n=1 Tax=Rhodoferax potami TaxID=3068338 RepID=UPI0028BD3DC3|nr:hypothetical protein [Rhodoferax sp. TBRC 17198]MDT7522035.1 hypothetical protein [Rhodoferax sp. TBRC 17198]
MNKFLELITVPIAAGGQSRFELSGDYFEIIDSAYPVTVLLEDRNGAQIGRMSGAEASYFLRDTPYTAITIESAKAQTVRIAFGSGEAGTRRTAGVVQVVDGGRARTIAGAAFISTISQTSSASNFAHVQLWNPSGSGKNLILKSLFSTVAVSGVSNYRATNAPMAVLVSNGVSKRIGGGVSAAELRRDSLASGLATPILAGFFIQASAPVTYKLDEPLVIPPGQGLVNVSGVNGDAQSTFEWFEETI